jgi:hypothetical protein
MKPDIPNEKLLGEIRPRKPWELRDEILYWPLVGHWVKSIDCVQPNQRLRNLGPFDWDHRIVAAVPKRVT